jgi:hypothetical protein
MNWDWLANTGQLASVQTLGTMIRCRLIAHNISTVMVDPYSLPEVGPLHNY